MYAAGVAVIKQNINNMVPSSTSIQKSDHAIMMMIPILHSKYPWHAHIAVCETEMDR